MKTQAFTVVVAQVQPFLACIHKMFVLVLARIALAGVLLSVEASSAFISG